MAEKTIMSVFMVAEDDGYSYQLEDGTVLTDDMVCKILAANGEKEEEGY